MIEIGKNNYLKVIDEVEFGMYLDDGEGNTVLLPTKYIPEGLKLLDFIEVFVYTDSEDRPIATTLTPKAKINEFSCLDVVDINSYGAFLDWGLEKDICVPYGQQEKDLTYGEKCCVYVKTDEVSNRVVGITKLKPFFNRDLSNLKIGDVVSSMVCDYHDLGIKLVVDGQYDGMAFKVDYFEDLVIGDIRKGVITDIREDGKITIRLRKTGLDAISELKERILEKLDTENGILRLHDKSSPDEIKYAFNVSKKIFKQAIGHLYREKKIKLIDGGIERI